jgi:hypothetical protein
VSSLFREYAGERFYYCSLITLECPMYRPALLAWSKEGLERAVEISLDPDKETLRAYLKWNHAEAPLFAYGEQYFEEVWRLWDLSTDLPLEGNADEWTWCYQCRLKLTAMLMAMQRLDEEGLFGRGPDRERIVINVEVMPPDFTNVTSARSLNPPAALVEWMQEAAEPDEQDD